MEPQRYHKTWLLIGATLLLGGFGLIAAQLVDLQVTRHEELAGKARKFWERRFVKASRRGDIRDARGTLLATSKPVKTVCADPSAMVTNYVEVARAIAPLLEMNFEELKQKLEPRWVTNKAGKAVLDQYVILKRKVEVERWREITNTMAHLRFAPELALEPGKKLPRPEREYFFRLRTRALSTEADEERVYPNGPMASHLIGFAGMTTKETPNGYTLVTSGVDGLELTLNSALNGVDGWVQTETDSLRREMVQRRDMEVAAREGLDAILTLDMGVQHIVESALAEAWEKHSPESVSAAVIRPKTGEILALANLPNFNPNAANLASTNDLRNRFVTDAYEPGSTFKVVVVSGALNDQLLSLHNVLNCENGRWFYGGKTLRDAHPCGMTTVEGIISHSSNIGSAKIGLMMGSDRLYEHIQAFGFGTRTGVLLPGESPGISHSPKSKNWNGLSVTRIPMGQGIATTPLQMLMAMAAIANDGVLMRPMILSRLEDQNGSVVMRYEPQPIRQVISKAAARETVKALKAVVSTNGTGSKAAIPFYTVAGKTGTAQKAMGGQYIRGKYFSSFIGFFPADNPELCISVVFDEPKRGYYGAEVAIPVFKNIAEKSARYLALPMEKAPAEKQPKEALAVIGVKGGN
jgi:cell division protein FtsI/penicillin-binding protein 2